MYSKRKKIKKNDRSAEHLKVNDWYNTRGNIIYPCPSSNVIVRLEFRSHSLRIMRLGYYHVIPNPSAPPHTGLVEGALISVVTYHDRPDPVSPPQNPHFLPIRRVKPGDSFWLPHYTFLAPNLPLGVRVCPCARVAFNT